MSSGASERILAGRLPGPRWPRLFAGQRTRRALRRATDVIVVVAAMVGLALLAASAVPTAGIERAVIRLTRSLPSGADGVWRIFVDLLLVVSLLLIVAAIVRRRFEVLRDIVFAVVVTVAGSVVINRVVHGAWPTAWDWWRATGISAPFPMLPFAVPAAVVLAVSPQLTRPARRTVRWLLGLGATGAILLGLFTPTGVVAAWLMAAVGAGLVHLAFGSCNGRPSLDEVGRALEGLGLPAESIGVADRQTAGTFVVDAVDRSGSPLLVKVYGRDAYDTQLLTSVWRSVWYREAGSPTAVDRVRQVEHEAFLTLLARQAGLLTQPVVAAATTAGDDVLLVLRPVGATLDTVPERFTATMARQVWDALDALHRAGISHGQVDDGHLVVEGDAVGFIDFRGATAAPGAALVHTDGAQALVATALALGPGPAVSIASDSVGRDGLADLLPFVQLTALPPASARRCARPTSTSTTCGSRRPRSRASSRPSSRSCGG